MTRRWHGGPVSVRQRIVLIVLLATLATASLATPALADRPTVDFQGIAGVDWDGATFNGRVTDGGERTDVWFRYCNVTAGDCPPSPTVNHGEPRAPGERDSVIQTIEPPEDFSSGETAVSQAVDGLAPSSRYRVTMIAANDTGSQFDEAYENETLTFDTAPAPAPAANVAPAARTLPATGVTSAGATLNAVVVAGTTGGSGATTAYFEWGAGDSLDRTTSPQLLARNDQEVDVLAGVSGLAAGTRYSFRVVAVREGQVVRGPTLSFVATPGPSCSGGTSFRTVEVQSLVATGCFRSAGGRWIGAGTIRLNGLTLTPGAPGTELQIDRAARSLRTTGSVTIAAGTLTPLYRGTLDLADVAFDGSAPLMSLGADRTVELLGFPLAGEFTFTPQSSGGGRLGLVIAMPGALGGVRGESAVGVSASGDLVLDRLRIEVGGASIKTFEVGDLLFEYDRLQDLWAGAAKLTLPTKPASVQIGVAVTVRGGRFGSLSGSVDGLNRHLGKGIFLQRIAASFGLDPLTIGGGVGISAGPRVLGTQALGLDGDFQFKDAHSVVKPAGYVVSYPAGMNVSGVLNVVSIPLAEGSVQVYFANFPWIEVAGRAGFDFKSGDTSIASLLGRVDGSLYGTRFSMSGGVRLALLGYDIAGAEAMLTTRGLAGCGYLNPFVFGAYYRWGESRAHLFDDVCGWSRLQALVGVSAAQAPGASTPLPLPAGRAVTLVKLAGDGAPPDVILRGPGGRTIAMPPPGQQSQLVEGSHFIARSPAEDATYVQVADTGTGAWSYELAPGSATVRSVQGADRLPSPRVRASVARRAARGRGRGRSRSRSRSRAAVLRWRLRAQPGQRVTFTEEGPGVPPRVIARTRRGAGAVAFRMADVRQRRRTIVALVEQAGIARETRVVARYRAPAKPRLRRPGRLRVARYRRLTSIRWRAVRGAQRYEVLIGYENGMRRMRFATKPRFVLERRGSRGLRRVSVRAVHLDGRRSRVARAAPRFKRCAKCP